MPTPRSEITSTVNGNNIYVIGGLDKSGKVLDTVEFIILALLFLFCY